MTPKIFALSLGILAASTCMAVAQNQQPTDEIGAILENKGQTTAAAIRAELERRPRNAILNYVSNNRETRIFQGVFSDLTPRDRFLIVSDDGCDVTVFGPGQTPGDTGGTRLLSKANENQNVEGPDGLRTTVDELQYNFAENTTYTIRVRYTNTIHSSPADLDGVTLFRFRLPDDVPADYTPKLSSRERTISSVVLFWDALPSGATPSGYRLYRSSSATFDASVTPIAIPTSQREYTVTGLNPNTNYHFHLIADYSTGTPATNRASPPAHHSFKTPRDAFRVIFDGETRAVAGGHSQLRNDAAHTVNLGGKIEKKDEAGNWISVPTTRFRLQLQNTEASEGAQLWDGTSYVTSPLEIETDAQSRFVAKVLSSRKLGSATLVVQENIGTAQAPEWEDIGDRTLEFAMPESRRLFGVLEWNQGANSDTGWDFSPSFFVSPSPNPNAPQIMRCRLFLRFRKQPNLAGDTNYFTRNGVAVASLDANNDNILSETELQGTSVRGSEIAPLTTVSGHPNPVWLPVNGHKLRVRIQSVGTTGDDMMMRPASKSSRVVAFSNSQGQYAVVGADDAIAYTDTRAELPEYLPVETRIITTPQGNIEGVAEFHLRAGHLVHRVNFIRFSVEDVTVK